MEDEMYLYLRLNHSLTFSLTRAIEIRAPDKDPLMALGEEIGSGAAQR